MESNETPLASLPTDRLILTLLQELAARVERLEKAAADSPPLRQEAGPRQTKNEAVATENAVNHHRTETKSNPGLISQSHGDDDGGVVVWYGQLLDNEAIGEKMKTIEERIRALAFDSKICTYLQGLGGIIQVPADFRLALTNYWPSSPEQASILKETVKFLDTLKEKKGSYLIRDFDLMRKQVQYEYGQQQKQSLQVPPVRRKSGPRREQETGPWQRLILLQGLSEMSASMTVGYRRPALSSAYLPIAKVPFLGDLWADSAVNMHLSQSFGEAMAVGGGYRFHLSWFRVTYAMWDLTQPRYGLGESKFGRLYGSADTSMCQEAYTIHAVPGNFPYESTLEEFRDQGSERFQQYWTILLLTPLLFYRPSGLKNVPIRVKGHQNSPLQINVVELIGDALGSASRGWRSLQEHIDNLLGTGAEIFDPELHDSLLFDDELFSGSRKYFWLINSLHTFDKVIQQNIEAWTSYRDRFLLPLSGMLQQEKEPNWKETLDKGIARCDKFETELCRLLKLFRDQRERTLALREGLFSASAVIESRASTRLGENVKLLTYVSIFYLPLAFCTSLWSTTDTFSFTTLGYVTVIVALTTYILVFNLNNIARVYKNRYQNFKFRIISEMVKDSDTVWGETGTKLNRHKPRNAQSEKQPSEWWVWAYLCLKLLKVLGIRKRNNGSRGQKEKAKMGRTASTSLSDSSTSQNKWYSLLLRKSTTKIEASETEVP